MTHPLRWHARDAHRNPNPTTGESEPLGNRLSHTDMRSIFAGIGIGGPRWNEFPQARGYHHLGIYAYRASFSRFFKLPRLHLEGMRKYSNNSGVDAGTASSRVIRKAPPGIERRRLREICPEMKKGSKEKWSGFED